MQNNGPAGTDALSGNTGEAGNPDTGARPPAWQRLRFEAAAAARAEPQLGSYLNAAILAHPTLCAALGYHVSETIAGPAMGVQAVRQLVVQAYEEDPRLVSLAEADLYAVLDRDPAARGTLQPFLFFKGFQALQIHRVANFFWRQGRETLSFFFQSRASEELDVDIHPAATIGEGVMLDHACGIVIGETSVVGRNCSILQGVTLGGTGKEVGDRHPKVGERVLISVGAKVLGNIRIGDGAKIAAGSVVLKAVPPGCTVAGVPARNVGGACSDPAQSMNQALPEGG